MPRGRKIKPTARLDAEDQAYIVERVKEDGVLAVATYLCKPEGVVEKYAIESGLVSPKPKIEKQETKQVWEPISPDEITKTVEWKMLKNEFLVTELEYFKHRYGRLIQQFQGDILPTEETQIFQLIKFEVLMQRNLKESKRGMSDIKRMERNLSEIYASFNNSLDDMDDVTRNNVMTIENQIVATKAAQNAKSSEFGKLQDKHSALMRELKATRDQRINKHENSKHSIVDLLKMLQDERLRSAESRQLELVKLATKKEKERLTAPHKFIDGNVERPVLTPDSV